MTVCPKIRPVRKLRQCLSLSLFICLGVYIADAQSVCTIDVSKPGAAVAPVCRGQQIEEFNYQFQGGLYAQLINNPSFEELRNPVLYWKLIRRGKSNGRLTVRSSKETTMLNRFQDHCIEMTVGSVASGNVGLANGGYWGIKLENNTTYKVSFWAKKDDNFKGSLIARLIGNDGIVYASSEELKPSGSWQHFTCDLVAKGVQRVSAGNTFLIEATSAGNIYFDVVTLMPPTWKNRPNGLRPDLAEKLADLKFRYIQFPGGCTAESGNMDTCWNWKNSIGPLEERAGSTRNRWDYKNDLYFGLDEYLQLCEDLDAEPVYTTSAGISESKGSKEWFAICPLDKMQPIIDDIIDLIEYCNGPPSTKWGAKRAANGHPQPYNLKYIEIGNENAADWSGTKPDYIPRYKLIQAAIAKRYPGIKFMYNGENGTKNLSSTAGNTADFVDEHFYMKDLSVMYSKYDSIDPSCKKICVAEYASSVRGNGGDVIGNFGDALGDAAFMLGCEKNSERMWWTGYGNYAGLIDHGNFGPCIVWNDALSCFATPSYYMQKMLFTDNAGTSILPFSQNTTDCFWSVSADRQSGKNDILIKVVNKKDAPETVNFNLKGAERVDPIGLSAIMTGPPDAENSIADPEKIIPVKGSFTAGRGFTYILPANSITVLRIKQAL